MPDGNLAELVAGIELIEARRNRLKALKGSCEDDLLAFVAAFWHVVEPTRPLVRGWPLELYCDLLMAVVDGHHTRVLYNCPPGFMKSLILNVFLPAWIWGPCGMPSTRFISASYAAYLTERDNGRLLRLLKDPTFQTLWPDVRLTKEGVGKLETTATGWKLATSVSGVGTGERGDWILIDDANNPLEVESEAVRATTNLWLREVMPDRLNDLERGIIFAVQQRTHEQDATGTLSHPEEGWPAFTWVALPMEYDPLRDNPVTLRWDEDGTPIEVWRDPRGLDEAGEPLEGRYVDAKGEVQIRGGSPLALADGTLAWPDRFSAEKVAEQKRIKGPYAYANQYQQLAQVRGGGIIRREWWRLWSMDTYPELGTVIASLDTAIKMDEESDYNALTVWGAFAQHDGSPGLILLEAWRLRASLAQLVMKVAETCWKRKVDYLLIEDKARGHDVASEIIRQYNDASWQTVLIPANGKGAFSGDKMARLLAVAPLFSGDVRKDPISGIDEWLGGMIYAPDRSWADEVIAEVASFPRGAHDDYCFVAGTLIATPRGDVPIEDVRRDDRVLTPFGWAAVTAAGQTGWASVVSRFGLTGTAGHPMFSLDRRYPQFHVTERQELSRLSLCGLMRLMLLSTSSSWASLTDEWEGSGGTISRNRARMQAARGLRDCMLPSGSTMRAGWFLLGMRSIIGTATLSIFALTIWSAYRKVCIAVWLRRMAGAPRFWRTLTTSGQWQSHGTNQPRGALGIASMLPRVWKRAVNHATMYAKSAADLLLPGASVPNIAGVPVLTERPGASTIQGPRLEDVSSVGRPLSLSERTRADAVRSASRVSLRKTEPLVPVFNLTVDGPHCYYANGILVHNCDSVSMAVAWVRRHGVVLRKVEYDREELAKRMYRRTPELPYAIRRGE